ncbi:MAG: hypothetical protein JW866_09730 [Ignavibacteriales bacterium]|nr:hypothetical protein [Ignavibacteriales bacterium]
MELNIYSLFQTLGLGIFLYYLIRGLKSEINGLKGTINAQNETLKVMDKRIEETEKIGNIYKTLIRDLPSDIENYKTIVSKTKDATIVELKNQYEITQQKLNDAEEKIEKSGNTQENIKIHLKILRNLLSKKKTKFGRNSEYFITKMLDSCRIPPEEAVIKIIDSHTLEEFLQKLGLFIEKTEDRSIPDTAFKTGKTSEGDPLYSAFISMSASGAWYSVINNNFYANIIAMDKLKDEFSSIKTIT